MANPSVTYTFTNSTTADGVQVSQNFADLISGMTDGTKTFSIAALTVAGTSTLGVINSAAAVTFSDATTGVKVVKFTSDSLVSTYNAIGLAPAAGNLARLRVHTSGDYGSGNLAIRHFLTTVTNEGTGITYASNTTDGASITIGVSGIYSFNYSDEFSASASMGLSINATATHCDNNIAGITTANRLVMVSTSAGDCTGEVSFTGYFVAGDVIRPHADKTGSGSSSARATLSCQRLL